MQSAQKLEKYNWNRIDTVGNDSANRVRENPTELMLTSELKSYSAMLDSMVSTNGMSAENAVKVRKAGYEKRSRFA